MATILKIPYEEVPDVVAEHGYSWAGELANWAWHKGYHTLRFQACGDGELLQSLEGGHGVWMANGPGPRGHDHAVVYVGASMIHDPHASREGILEITGATVFIPRDQDS